MFEVDATETALDAAGIAHALRMLGREAQGTIGEVAGLVLCTAVDDETSRPEGEHMAAPFEALCSVIAEQLRQAPAHELFRRDQGSELWCFRGDAALMMKIALTRFRPWHSAILELWADRPADVARWIDAKLPLFPASPAWMSACKDEINSGRVVELQQAAAAAKPLTSVADELQVYKTLVVRMYLAGLKNAEGEEKSFWRHLGFLKADRRDIDAVFEKRGVEFRDFDASKRYVSMAMVDVLGEAFVKDRYPAVYQRFELERPKDDKKR